MSTEIVKYHNDMNKVNLGNFLVKELDLFFSLCFKLKESGENEIKISFADIQNLIGEGKNFPRIKLYVDNLNKKLAQLNYQIEISPKIFERFVLFTNFTSNYNDNTLTIKVNDKFNYILNNVIGNFTKFDLIEFVSLKSTYSKNMFKILKQWEFLPAKQKIFTIEEFREMLLVPQTYRMSIIDIKVLSPIKEEVSKYFKDLKIEKIKTGKRITSIKFSWGRKKEDIIEGKTIEIVLSEKLNKVIVKAKKNLYINKFLKDEHIKELLEIFEEKQLILGLEYAYNNINEDFKKIIYLENSIKKGIDNQKIKITSTKSVEIEKKEIIQTCIITKVSPEEYNQMYFEYLQKNELKDNKVSKITFQKMNENKFEIINEVSQEEQEKKKRKKEIEIQMEMMKKELEGL
jgi:plasmid replication initiation protein